VRGHLGAYLAVTATVVIWGTVHPTGKLALRDAAPFHLILARSLLPGLILSALLLAQGRLWLLRDDFTRRPGTIVGLGLLAFVGQASMSMTSLQYLPASINGLLVNTSPLLLAVGLVALQRALPSPRVLLGLLLGFAGVALLSARGGEGGAVHVLGVALAVGGAANWALYTAWSRRVLTAGDPIAVTAGASLVGTAVFLIVGALTGQLATLAALPPRALLLILYIGAIGTALSYVLWSVALRRLSATNVMAFQYLTPLTAVTLGVIGLGEPLTLELALGGAAILLGVALAQETPVQCRPHLGRRLR
jgi:drug/metabolite transporter (DMT)-like permease